MSVCHLSLRPPQMKPRWQSTARQLGVSMWQARHRALSWPHLPNITLVTQWSPDGRGGCPLQCLCSHITLQATANLRQHCNSRRDRQRQWRKNVLNLIGLRVGKGRRWPRQEKQKFNRKTKQEKPEGEMHHIHASSSKGSSGQKQLCKSPAQRSWHKRPGVTRQQHNGRKRRRNRVKYHHHSKPLHQGSGGHRSPKESQMHSPATGDGQPQACHFAHNCNSSLGLQQPCESAMGSNKLREEKSKSRNGESSLLCNMKDRSCNKGFHVPLYLLQEVRKYFHPKNTARYCPPGMRAPHNTTQYVMEQHQDAWENETEEAVAMNRGNGINSTMNENVSLTDFLPSMAQEDYNTSTEEEEEEGDMEVEEDDEEEENMQFANLD